MGCNSISLASLDASCSQSKGGIVEVYLIPYEYISGTTEGSGATISESAETEDLVTGISYAGTHTVSDWQMFRFRKNTGSMTSTLTIDEANGVSYIETELTMLFTRMETDKRVQMVALAKGEVAAVVKDSNGHFWFLGMNEGVVASAGTGQTGQNKTDGNYYQVTLKDSSDEYPYEVDLTLANAIATAAAAHLNA